MSLKKAKSVSIKYTKREFTSVGLTVFLYTLMVLIIPHALLRLFEVTDSIVIHDDFLYFGIYYIVLSFGSLIPFLILKSNLKISTSRLVKHTHMSFADLLVNAIVYFSVASLMIFITMMIANRFHISGSIASDIAVIYDEAYLNNWLYLLMFVILSPFLEEYIFRGILLKTLDRYGKRFGIIVSSLIYALAHNSFIDMIPSFFMAILLCQIVEHYHSLQPTIFIHIAFNMFLVFLSNVPLTHIVYSTYALACLYLIAVLLILTKRFRFISVSKSDNGGFVYGLFFSNGAVLFAVIMLVVHSVLRMLF